MFSHSVCLNKLETGTFCLPHYSTGTLHKCMVKCLICEFVKNLENSAHLLVIYLIMETLLYNGPCMFFLRCATYYWNSAIFARNLLKNSSPLNVVDLRIHMEPQYSFLFTR